MEDFSFYEKALTSYFREGVEILSVTGEHGDQIGIHGISNVKLIKVEFKTASRTAEVHLAHKHSKEGALKLFRNWEISECQFFRVFIPSFLDFISSHAEGQVSTMKRLFPVLYFADDQGTILMENLFERGLYLERKPQNILQANLVIGELAKFHAVSYGMIQALGGTNQFILKYPFLDEKHFTDGPHLKSMWKIFRLILHVMEHSNNSRHKLILERMKKYENSIEDVCAEVVRPGTWIDVLNHGDLLGYNILFSSDQKELVFIDFQLTRVCSPSIDLVYYLMWSTDHAVKENWNALLQFYMEKFTITIKELGGTTPFDLEELVSDFRRKSKYGFFRGLTSCLGPDVLPHFFPQGVLETEQVFRDRVIPFLEKNPTLLQRICDSVENYYNGFMRFGEL